MIRAVSQRRTAPARWEDGCGRACWCSGAKDSRPPKQREASTAPHGASAEGGWARLSVSDTTQVATNWRVRSALERQYAVCP